MIVRRQNIRPGAIIVLDDRHGEPHHAMFWSGERDEKGEPLLIGFNEMTRGSRMSYGKDGQARVGTIIDINRIVENAARKKRNAPFLKDELGAFTAVPTQNVL